MLLFILSLLAKSKNIESDNIIFISQDLLIGCIEGTISDYTCSNVKRIPFQAKKEILMSLPFKEHIKDIKLQNSFKKISSMASKVKIILFKYDDHQMMLVHSTVVFMDTFYEFFDMFVSFNMELSQRSIDVYHTSVSLHREIKRLDCRFNKTSKVAVHNMVKDILDLMCKIEFEICNMNLSFNSRSSESVLLGFYYISNYLNFQIDYSILMDFGGTSLKYSDRFKILQAYRLNENYEEHNMYDLVDMYSKMFLVVEVKSRILHNKKRGIR